MLQAASTELLDSETSRYSTILCGYHIFSLISTTFVHHATPQLLTDRYLLVTNHLSLEITR
jgi:hypothetical protein